MNENFKNNSYEIIIKEWYKPDQAEEGVNEFIEECNDNYVEILDMSTHVTETGDVTSYIFIFKVKDLMKYD